MILTSPVKPTRRILLHVIDILVIIRLCIDMFGPVIGTLLRIQLIIYLSKMENVHGVNVYSLARTIWRDIKKRSIWG
jgi:hypothetical protein